MERHVRFKTSDEGEAKYAGIRLVDGQALALLRYEKETVVLPVDEATARRLKQLTVGRRVAVTAQGIIHTKGRSR